MKRKMKNIDDERLLAYLDEKLLAYLENRFKVLDKVYNLERENEKKAVSPDEINDILQRMAAINAKRSVINYIRHDILGIFDW